MDRVLRPGGVIAVFGYHFHEPVGCAGADEFTALRKSIFEEGDFAESWDPRKKLIVDEEYKTIPQLTYEQKERSVEVELELCPHYLNKVTHKDMENLLLTYL